MAHQRMHRGEVPTDVGLVRRLLEDQLPHWAQLPIRSVRSPGTVNALYRLGDTMVVRLPRHERWIEDIDLLHRWLPFLKPQLPIAIPAPLAKGDPGHDYPFRWSVYSWIDGATPPLDGTADSQDLATDLAGFISALHNLDPTDAPAAERGGPVSERDDRTRRAIASLEGRIDSDAVTAAWEASLAAEDWNGSPVWIHGDLLPSNVLVDRGRLSGVIDFGGIGVGDPACDLLAAWSLLSARSRTVFRATVGADAATWLRGRGWALSIALIILPYYSDTNPAYVTTATRIVREVLEDAGSTE